MYNTFASPWLLGGRNQSRFQFAHSVDPIKKDGSSDDGLFKFGLGLHNSEVDKDEIQVPIKVQAYIQRSLRTLSGSDRSPDVAVPLRSTSHSLKQVDEELMDELEQKWYTLEERAQEQMQLAAGAEATQPNPFRSLHKKEKDAGQQIAAGLKVERVKYKVAGNMAPADEAKAAEEYDKSAQAEKSKDALRPKGVRRAGPAGQADRTRQPPYHR